MINKPYTHKRIIAYIIDILIVSAVTSMITYFIPVKDEYKKASEELTTVVESYTNKDITIEEYTDKVNELNYTISINSVDSSLIGIAIAILYFVVYGYYSNGETLGKKLMKIKIVGNNDQTLTINNYLVRSLLVNTVLADIVSTGLIFCLTKSQYLTYYPKISSIFSLLYVLCFGLMLFRDDGRGLHDLIAKTKVISKKEIANNEVKEADVIKEEKKKENNKKEEIKVIESKIVTKKSSPKKKSDDK